MLNSNPIHVGLSQNFVFHTTYLSSEWDAASQTHTLTLQPASGPSYTHITDILISANGPLCAPLLPPIPGVSSFRGTAFHNLHWRKHQPDLVNKKVAVIGNGSSGIQLLPGVAKTPGAEVVQYVRSGGYYFPKVNAEIAGWQKAIYRWVPGARWYHRYQLFKGHNDRWKARNAVEADGHDATEQMLLDYLRQQTPPEYLEALTPKYRGWLTLRRRHVTSDTKRCLYFPQP
jgi:cation diffusion facilitator CzcD-associated flavoprotein CzcO